MQENTNDKTKIERLYSLDALRGFDMFWIIGGDVIIRQLANCTHWGWMNTLKGQMHHVSWDGFHFYDLIFPLFMFISGVSIPYAIESKRKYEVSEKIISLHIIRRVATLVLFGLIYNGMLRLNFTHLRYFSVLGQIGIAYGIAALIYQYSKHKKNICFWILSILLIYSAVQLLIPVPGHGAGVLTRAGSINAYIDRMFAFGRLHNKIFDPEGYLCILSASTVTLSGILAGLVLRNSQIVKIRKCAILAVGGISILIIGVLLSFVYPIIKSLWTPSFNLVTIGCSSTLLAIFYLIIDVLKFRKWAFFFTVIGMNSITIYMAGKFIDFHYASHFFFGGIADMSGDYKGFVLTLGVLITEWILLFILYRKKIFLKV